LDSHSPSTLLQTLQARPNPQGSPRAPWLPTRSVGVVPAARFCAVTAASESSAAVLLAHPRVRAIRCMRRSPCWGVTDSESLLGMAVEAAGPITDSRGVLTESLPSFFTKLFHKPVNRTRERASSRSVTIGPQARRELFSAMETKST